MLVKLVSSIVVKRMVRRANTAALSGLGASAERTAMMIKNPYSLTA